MRVSENRKLLSFQGIIGRKWFFYKTLTAFLIPLGLLLPILLFYFVKGEPGKSISENVNPRTLAENANPLGLAIIMIWSLANFTGAIAFLLAQISLQIRRGRDIFFRTKSSFWIEALCVVVFYLTRGFFGIGGLVLFFWPGLLHREPERSIAPTPTEPDQNKSHRRFLLLKIFAAAVPVVFLGVIALAWMFSGTSSGAPGCPSIAADWVDAIHSNRHIGKFTLGPNQVELLKAIPKFEGQSLSAGVIAGVKAVMPIRKYLPNFLKTCGEFAKTISKTCPAIREAATKLKLDPEEQAVMTFRLTLADRIQETLTPVDFEQIRAQELISFMSARYPALCGNSN